MTQQRKLRTARALVLWTLALGTFAGGAAAAPPGASPQPIPSGAGFKSWQDNGSNGRYVLRVIEGKAPAAGRRAVGLVVSDTDCDADAQGLSHCHNVIKFADGTQLTVIDTHNMHRYRCLGPGDRLTLTRLGDTWVVGTLAPR